MLYDRWRAIVRDHADEIALRDLPSARQWTFAELDAAALARSRSGPVVFPRGMNADFIFAVLQAWRDGSVTCPVEGRAPLDIPAPPRPIAHLKLTSATTGASKLVAFTAEQLAADADNIVATMKLRRDCPNLAVISLAHSYGFSNLVTPLLLHGIPLILGGAPLPEVVRAAGTEFPALTLPAVPALWRAWHEADAIPHSVRIAISAGAPLALALEQEIHARRGLKVHNFYGASECGGIAYDAGDTPRTDGTYVGRAMANVVLSVNRDGCLEVRGRAVGEGYWPQAACSLADSVYVTSDLAALRDDGVFLHGRASDVINVAGRKVSPESIETALAEHPAVRACLVFGVPGPEDGRGETIIACVAPRRQTAPEELRQHLLARLDSWQVPRDFWIVDSLEANARGKMPRAHWRQQYLEKAK